MLKNIIFLGRKEGSIKALKLLIDNKFNILAVVGVSEDSSFDNLKNLAEDNNILFLPKEDKLYQLINSKQIQDVDLVISYLYSKRIKLPLIRLGKLGCINFHPAPLPDYKSSAGYNMAILEGKKEFGASVHFINSEAFDSGPIIKVIKFPITENENMMSLYEKTQKKLLELFKDTVALFQSTNKIRTYENKGGLYLTRKQLEELKEIDLERDNINIINRKIKAFFFPPYSGAKIKVKGQYLTLINEEMLKFLNKLLMK